MARSIGRANTRFGEGAGQLDHRRARGVLNPCTGEPKARTGEILRGKLISDHGGLFFLPARVRKPTRSRERGQDFKVVFRGCRRLLDGWMLARALASPAQGPHRHGPRYNIFLYYCMMTIY